ncbi:MAG: 6-bladed beta-propeller [Candidatus Aminicenantes bacterium]|nr:6-bladed beta-propeller [Candidatus Aminicenantes bacterium]
MKRLTLLILAAAVLSSMAAAQIIIENPAKPLSEKAGRVVTLKEEMRLEDTGEGFFFKNPYTIRVSPRGDIFIKDGQEQALQFDPQGRFVRNLFKKGQGPGELTSLHDIWASPDRLYLLGYPPKILIYDYEGNLVQELPLRGGNLGGRFILADPANLLVYGTSRPDAASGTGFIDIPWDITEIAPDGASLKTIGSFPIRTFQEVQAGGAVSGTAWNLPQVVALNGNSLFLNYTPEYMIDNFVKDKQAVGLRFRRPYTRVKRSSGGGVSGSAGSGPPPPEFLPDIYALHIVDGHLWVQTRTVTEEKGNLFDVFDTKGRYIDSFYIQSMMKNEDGGPARLSMTIVGGFAYFKEETSDGLIVIRKCRLVGL